MTIPASTIAVIQATTTDEAFLALMTIRFSATDVQHVVNNTDPITSRGVVYQPWPFTLSLPNQLENTSAQATLNFDNVDPAIWQALRNVDDIPSVHLEIVMSGDPDVVVLSYDHLKLRNAQATANVVTISLYVDSIWQTGYPANDYTPGEYPGLFAS